MRIFRKMTLVHKGLRYKLMLAFSLMTIIPLLACGYVISTYVFPQTENLANVSIVVAVSLIIGVLGLVLARGLVDPVIDMAIEAKIIAEGEYDKRLAISSDDEIGNLATSINVMTQKIKSNLEELKSYGQRMREINVEIHKKVFALSSLLQIGDAISVGSLQLDALLEMTVQKAAMLFDTGFGALYMSKDSDEELVIRTSYNIDKENMDGLVIKKDGLKPLEKSLRDHSTIIVDKSVKLTKDLADLASGHNLKNFIAFPLYAGKRDFALLLVGNRLDDFKYKNDEIELVKVFAKQVTIAIESDILSKRTKELAIVDDLTNLYNKPFILTRLEEEIKRAIFYQRPCSFVVFNVDNFRPFREKHGELAGEDVLKKIAKMIKDNVMPVGKAARIGGDEFAMLLPEKNKKEAMEIAEDIRRKVESTNFLREGKEILTICAGVSENPIDGTTQEELFKKAMEAVRQAKALGKNRVVE